MTKQSTSKSATVKVYHGYGHMHNLVLYGHVLKGRPSLRGRLTNNIFLNIIDLVQLFFVNPLPGVKVRLHWNDQQFESTTASDGFFKFEWKSDLTVPAGWHPVVVDILDGPERLIGSGEGKLFVPHKTQFAFISDIDDTVLISHSAS
ncbi:MAG: hypothetical protein H7X88_06955, partial [Gloeobacteraceae cyanobacterium ES-bin-316]|nr:hypothetical protein [Ferruginibacter sp.]